MTISSIWNPDKVIQAWRFAADAHQGQTVPGTDLPYLTHLGQVTMEIMRAVAAEPVSQPDLPILCAILHDIIEDTSVTYDPVLKKFGPAVANGVLALTKDATLPTKAEQMDDSLVRIKQQPQEVWMVKLADRISNLGPPPHHWTPEKIRFYHDEALKIHRELGEASAVLSDRLQSRIKAYESFA